MRQQKEHLAVIGTELIVLEFFLVAVVVEKPNGGKEQ